MNKDEQQQALIEWACGSNSAYSWSRLGEAIVHDPKGFMFEMVNLGLLSSGSINGHESFRVVEHHHHYRAKLATPISGDRVEVVWRCDCGVQGTTVSDLEVPHA